MSKLLDTFKQLEKSLLSALDQVEALENASTKVLEEYKEKLINITELDVLNIALERDLPQQYYNVNQFGYFNVTLFQNDKFNIQVYIMNDIDTEIHDHTFNGAFMLLTGKTIEKKYLFHKNQDIDEGIYKGTTQEESSRVFTPGSIGELNDDFIHQIIRLAKTNITLIITDAGKDKNRSKRNGFILPPHVYIINRNLGPNFYRKVAALQIISQKDSTLFKAQSELFLKNLSLYEVLTLVTRFNIYQFNVEYEESFQAQLMGLAKNELNIRGHEEIIPDYIAFLKKQKNKINLIK